MADTITKPNTKSACKMAREPESNDQEVPQGGGINGVHVDPVSPKAPSKTSLILDMIQRAEGATLEQMVEATGWLPHTTRAAMTGLRKKGHAIVRTRVDHETRYTLAAAAPQ